eukprot:TRINITY_DN25880_c0_g1_i1.p1 TRINITY_DN25880_c0_g1~~TRINITY_DN25880_c0_g1_i1.p1  ORF type:complete len:463 (-),score=52.61 TRINITY_DN25880_c0_g1_i1:28-1416(-)
MRQMETVQAALTRGLEAIAELKHPMCVVKLKDFCDMSLEEVQNCHEGARDAGKVIFLDTLGAVDRFRAAGSKLLFFSYTWKSWYKLGPDIVQLECMQQAACKLCKLREEDVLSMYIWLDVMAIPQINPKCKAQAVDNLFSYASIVDYFIAICPDGIHEDSHEPAGTHAYRSRVWCRIEQVAHCSVNGFRNMYHSLGPEHLEPIEESWIKQIIHIFEAETTCCRRGHPDGTPCDRQLLVPTLLAMYAVLLERLKGPDRQSLQVMHSRSLQSVWWCMNEDVDRSFPRTYIYKRPDGKQEERLLFGNAVSCIHELAKKGVGMVPVKNMLSSSHLQRRGWSSLQLTDAMPSDARGSIAASTARTSPDEGRGLVASGDAFPDAATTHAVPLPIVPPMPPCPPQSLGARRGPRGDTCTSTLVTGTALKMARDDYDIILNERDIVLNEHEQDIVLSEPACAAALPVGCD